MQLCVFVVVVVLCVCVVVFKEFFFSLSLFSSSSLFLVIHRSQGQRGPPDKSNCSLQVLLRAVELGLQGVSIGQLVFTSFLQVQIAWTPLLDVLSCLVLWAAGAQAKGLWHRFVVASCHWLFNLLCPEQNLSSPT